MAARTFLVAGPLPALPQPDNGVGDGDPLPRRRPERNATGRVGAAALRRKSDRVVRAGGPEHGSLHGVAGVADLPPPSNLRDDCEAVQRRYPAPGAAPFPVTSAPTVLGRGAKTKTKQEERISALSVYALRRPGVISREASGGTRLAGIPSGSATRNHRARSVSRSRSASSASGACSPRPSRPRRSAYPRAQACRTGSAASRRGLSTDRAARSRTRRPRVLSKQAVTDAAASCHRVSFNKSCYRRCRLPPAPLQAAGLEVDLSSGSETDPE